MLRRNEWRDVADAIVRFCKNVGIDECFLLTMPSFWQNVGIEYTFTLANQSFCDKFVICV